MTYSELTLQSLVRHLIESSVGFEVLFSSQNCDDGAQGSRVGSVVVRVGARGLGFDVCGSVGCDGDCGDGVSRGVASVGGCDDAQVGRGVPAGDDGPRGSGTEPVGAGACEEGGASSGCSASVGGSVDGLRGLECVGGVGVEGSALTGKARRRAKRAAARREKRGDATREAVVGSCGSVPASGAGVPEWRVKSPVNVGSRVVDGVKAELRRSFDERRVAENELAKERAEAQLVLLRDKGVRELRAELERRRLVGQVGSAFVRSQKSLDEAASVRPDSSISQHEARVLQHQLDDALFRASVMEELARDHASKEDYLRANKLAPMPSLEVPPLEACITLEDRVRAVKEAFPDLYPECRGVPRANVAVV